MVKNTKTKLKEVLNPYFKNLIEENKIITRNKVNEYLKKQYM